MNSLYLWAGHAHPWEPQAHSRALVMPETSPVWPNENHTSQVTTFCHKWPLLACTHEPTCSTNHNSTMSQNLTSKPATPTHRLQEAAPSAVPSSSQPPRLAMCPWEGSLTSLKLYFLICKQGRFSGSSLLYKAVVRTEMPKRGLTHMLNKWQPWCLFSFHLGKGLET